MTGLFLGLDAGNSKTVALVARSDGQVVGWGRAGVGDIYGLEGSESAAQQVLLAVRSALAQAGSEPGDLVGGAFRLAGVDWEEDAAFWAQVLDLHLPTLRNRTIKNDGFAVLRWGDLDGAGIAVAAGTGPAVAGRGPDGEFAASWWIQEPLGGAAVGEAAFRAVMRSHLGIEPPTAMTDALVELEQVRDVEELLWEYTRRVGPRNLHHLKRAARLVLRAAEEGDPAATAIVRYQATHLAQYVLVAARRCGWAPDSDVPVVLGGSLLTSSDTMFRRTMVHEVARYLPGARVVAIGGSPAAGALLDAFAENGVTVTEALRERVRTADVPAELFRT